MSNMARRLKQMLTILLAVSMLAGNIPVNVFAAETGTFLEETTTMSEENGDDNLQIVDDKPEDEKGQGAGTDESSGSEASQTTGDSQSGDSKGEDNGSQQSEPEGGNKDGQSGDTNGEAGNTDGQPEKGGSDNTDGQPEKGGSDNTDGQPEEGEDGNTDGQPEKGEDGNTDGEPEKGGSDNADGEPENDKTESGNPAGEDDPKQPEDEKMGDAENEPEDAEGEDGDGETGNVDGENGDGELKDSEDGEDGSQPDDAEGDEQSGDAEEEEDGSQPEDEKDDEQLDDEEEDENQDSEEETLSDNSIEDLEEEDSVSGNELAIFSDTKLEGENEIEITFSIPGNFETAPVRIIPMIVYEDGSMDEDEPLDCVQDSSVAENPRFVAETTSVSGKEFKFKLEATEKYKVSKVEISSAVVPKDSKGVYFIELAAASTIKITMAPRKTFDVTFQYDSELVYGLDVKADKKDQKLTGDNVLVGILEDSVVSFVVNLDESAKVDKVTVTSDGKTVEVKEVSPYTYALEPLKEEVASCIIQSVESK